MCYHLSCTRNRNYIESRFTARFLHPELFRPLYHVSAFATPYLPVICNNDARHIKMFQWGLVPFWAKDEQNANKIRFSTFNARAETIFEKPSFKSSIKKKRCLVIIDGFYEWREVNGKKYPYYIFLKSKDLFALAGLWDVWEKAGKGECTFSIITTEANPLMQKIHNRKRRMPVILKKEDEKHWLDENIDRTVINSMLKPFEQEEMDAYTISRLITRKGRDTNVFEVLQRHEYEELSSLN